MQRYIRLLSVENDIKPVFLVFVLRSGVLYPEFCKRLSKKCSEHRINKGVQSIFEMHRSVVFFSIFEFIKILYFYVLIHGYFFDF